MTVMLSLSYLRYLCFFTSTVVISIQVLPHCTYKRECRMLQNGSGIHQTRVVPLTHELEHGKQRGSNCSGMDGGCTYA